MALKLCGYAIATVGLAMVGNFFYYWMHRAQHAVPLLWRFHRVHHSIAELSVTRAAERLGRTQSAVSHSLARLRQQLGDPLLLKGARRMEPTPFALALLFLAGLFELSFSSMAQTLVQVNAPNASRGRVLGLYNMASMGLRAFSGITVGLAGSVVGIHISLAGAAGLLIVVIVALMLRARRLVGPETSQSPIPVAVAAQRSRTLRAGAPDASDPGDDAPR